MTSAERGSWVLLGTILEVREGSVETPLLLFLRMTDYCFSLVVGSLLTGSVLLFLHFFAMTIDCRLRASRLSRYSIPVARVGTSGSSLEISRLSGLDGYLGHFQIDAKRQRIISGAYSGAQFFDLPR